MSDTTASQIERAERMWDAFNRAGLLVEARVNGADRVRVRWMSPTLEAFGAIEHRVPSVELLEHEYVTASRGDVIDIGDGRYAVIGVDRAGKGRAVLRLEKQE